MYDPKAYWADRGHWLKDPKSRFEDPDELGSLAGWVREIQPENVLEVGSGHGRVYEYLKPLGLAGDFVMCDIAESMLDGCEERTGIRPDLWDGVTLPYDDRAFDLVVSFSVLLHQPPSGIDRLFSEHVRVARWVFVATCTRGISPQSSYCFNQDYRGLIARAGLRVVKERVFHSRSRGQWERTHWLLEGK